jgi:hypothetical protein
MAKFYYRNVDGTAQAADGAADATVLAAPGADRQIRILKGYVTVHVAAAGGSGKVALEDGVGGTRFFEADANAVGHFPIDFEPEGYPLTANTLLNLTVDGAVTTEATARCTITALQKK